MDNQGSDTDKNVSSAPKIILRSMDQWQIRDHCITVLTIRLVLGDNKMKVLYSQKHSKPTDDILMR